MAHHRHREQRNAQTHEAAARARQGNAMRARGRHAEAIAHYETALSLRPNDPDVLNNLGNALAAVGRHEAAVPRYREAIALTPNAGTHHNLATALEALDRAPEALEHYRHALDIKPGLLEARLGLANVLRQLGRIDEARREYEAVIAVAPRVIAAYHGLGVTRRFTDGDPYLAALEGIASKPASLSEADQIYLHFALGKAYDDVGQHERSLRHFLEGNRIKRRRCPNDEARLLGYMDGCRNLFTPGFLRGMAGHGDPSRVPVFIVGMARSGSTLVEQILASHPAVFGAGERPYFEHALTAARQTASGNGAADGAWIGHLASGYLGALTAAAPAASRITDKLLGNFNHVGMIHLALPNARIIHVSRDPLDACLSSFSQLFTAPAYFYYDLAELGRYYRQYARLMAHWREVLPAGVMLDVRYEDVVADFEIQARRIVAHCGLEWDPSCLDFHRAERAVRTASVAQVRQPLYATSVGRAEKVRSMLRPLIEALAGADAGLSRERSAAA